MSCEVVKDSKIVERELLRKRLYNIYILQWMTEKLPTLRYKEVCHLLLRYIFNKNITKTSDDDPVFITTKSTIAETQLQKDFKYNKLDIDCKQVVKELEERILKCSDTIKECDISRDKKVYVADGKISYKKRCYTDISNLAKKYPSYSNYALALNIRYTYLHLLNHGLARKFKEMDYSPSEATEGFASAFNHYFDNFCSAFPDLETPFGSQGSFFDNSTWKTREVFVNPPFDDSLMSCAMERVYKYLETNKEEKTNRKFIFTLPNWKDYPELDRLKTSKWTTNVVIYKKGELPFIDYMKGERTVYPCDIAEITLKSSGITRYFTCGEP